MGLPRNMKILLAPDKFKGSIDSITLCRLMQQEIIASYPDAEVESFPMADGGDGYAAIVKHYFNTSDAQVLTVDPLGRQIKATYQISKETSTAYIEMAAASGFALLAPHELDPMKASTYGTGLMILDAIKRGSKEIFLGIGGSATNDGGTGMADALGYMLLDKNGDPLEACGENLASINEIIMPETDLLEDIHFTVAYDVSNPFFGLDGAAHVYAPQKGATAAQVDELDEGLKHLDTVFMKYFGRSVEVAPGAGAAGGMGGGCDIFLGARLVPGVDHLIAAVGLDNKIASADILITGEGRLDEQSFQGKVIGKLVDHARKHGTKLYAICGDSSMNIKDLNAMGVDRLVTLASLAGSKEEAMAHPDKFLSAAIKKIL